MLYPLFKLCTATYQIQDLTHANQVLPPLPSRILSISNVPRWELLQAFQVTVSMGPESLRIMVTVVMMTWAPELYSGRGGDKRPII